ncbi:hypothetical protein ACV3V0_16750 [Clostridium perfringens]
MDSILPSNNEINSAAVDEAFKIANNAIYFNDSSDYLSALYQICKKLNPAISEYNIGLEYLEECSIKKHRPKCSFKYRFFFNRYGLL